MRIKKALAIGGTAVALAGAVALPATAGASSHRPLVTTHVFPTTLSPSSGIHTGTVLTMKGHGAKKSTSYTCVMGVQKGAKYWIDTNSLKGVKSTKLGKVKCVVTFKPYTAVQAPGGPTGSHKCPVTKKDRRHGYSCSMSISTIDRTSAGNELFKAKH